MVRAAVFLSVLILVFNATPQHGNTAMAAAAGAAMSTSRIVSHGVELRLALPRFTYPRDALVRVGVTVQNVSRRAVSIGWSRAPVCDWRGPGVEVLNGSGKLVYPPAIPWLTSCGPPEMPRLLLPEHSLHHQTFAVLRGTFIRAVVSLTSGQQLATPPLRLSLVHETAPALTVRTTPNLHLLVRSGIPAQRGPFYFMDGILCLPPKNTSAGSGFGEEESRWGRGTVRRDGAFHLVARCATPRPWVFTGGWVGHPVVSMDYTAPALLATRSSGGRVDGVVLNSKRSAHPTPLNSYGDSTEHAS